MTPAPTPLGDEFLELVRDDPTVSDHEAAENWFRGKLGLNIETTYLSELSKMFTARVGQALVHMPDGLLLISPGSFEDTTRDGLSFVDKLANIVAWAPRLQAIITCVSNASGLVVAYVIGPTDSPAFARCRAAFPTAHHRPVDVPLLQRELATQLPATMPEPDVDVDELARELYVEPPWLREVVDGLVRRDRTGRPTPRAVILYGPPGTGKTYLARRLARRLVKRDDMCGFVQLHPSYGYEDFFEGYRPAMAPGGLALEKRSGPLRRLADRARSNPDELAVLVMDEVNRGNLPRVFGELYFLLEYRDEAIGLMYSPDERFSLPPNLLLMGTMNTADRSVVGLDQALRRRFDFVGMFPDQPPVANMLQRFLAANYPDGRLAWVADVVEQANRHLDRNVQIGPSFFMRDDLDDSAVGRIWRTSVLPSIEDQFFGRQAGLDALALDLLRNPKP